jgi:Bor protein
MAASRAIRNRRSNVTNRENRRQRFAGLLGLALAAFAALSSTACYKATFVEKPSEARREPTHSEWTHHYLLGLIGSGEYDASELCPNGTAAVRTAGDAATGALTIATLGIYAPRRVYVTCASSRTASNHEVQR